MEPLAINAFRTEEKREISGLRLSLKLKLTVIAYGGDSF